VSFWPYAKSVRKKVSCIQPKNIYVKKKRTRLGDDVRGIGFVKFYDRTVHAGRRTGTGAHHTWSFESRAVPVPRRGTGAPLRARGPMMISYGPQTRLTLVCVRTDGDTSPMGNDGATVSRLIRPCKRVVDGNGVSRLENPSRAYKFGPQFLINSLRKYRPLEKAPARAEQSTGLSAVLQSKAVSRLSIVFAHSAWSPESRALPYPRHGARESLCARAWSDIVRSPRTRLTRTGGTSPKGNDGATVSRLIRSCKRAVDGNGVSGREIFRAGPKPTWLVNRVDFGLNVARPNGPNASLN